MAQVRIILRDDVYGLGEAGEVVSVKPGYARNYLLPQGLAALATEAKVREIEHQRRAIAELQAKRAEAMQSEKQKIEKLELEVEMQAGEEGRLFGSVTATRIAELLAEQGITIDRRKLSIAEPIKSVGEHSAHLKLHREVVAEVRLQVVASGAPAEEDDDVVDEDEAEESPAEDDAADDAPGEPDEENAV